MDDSTDSQVSWYFSDEGNGSSIEEDTSTEFSYPDNFNKEVYDLHILQERLVHEDAKLEQIIRQIQDGKAEIDNKRLAAERAILQIHLKTKLLLSNFKNRFVTEKNVFFRIGTATLTNIKLHYGVGKNKNHSYFLCTLASDSKFFISQICDANAEGVVDFNINHTFCNLAPDFKISLKIYILPVPKTTCLNKIKKTIQKLFKRDPGSIMENFCKRESHFKFWKEVNFSVSNANKTNEFFLEIFNSQLVKITTDVTVTLNTDDFSHKGWLDMSRNDVFWCQRWCVLSGTELKYYNCPTDDQFNNEVARIDLLSCVSARILKRAQASRDRVLILEMADDCANPFFYYLATTSKNEFFQWSVIPKFVETLQLWKQYNVLPK